MTQFPHYDIATRMSTSIQPADSFGLWVHLYSLRGSTLALHGVRGLQSQAHSRASGWVLPLGTCWKYARSPPSIPHHASPPATVTLSSISVVLSFRKR